MDELRKSIESHNLAQRLQVETLGDKELLQKAIPMGTVNKYGKTKTEKGWVYVKKGKREVTGSNMPKGGTKSKKDEMIAVNTLTHALSILNEPTSTLTTEQFDKAKKGIESAVKSGYISEKKFNEIANSFSEKRHESYDFYKKGGDTKKPAKPKKVTIEPGGTYTAEEWASTLRKSTAGKKKFIKDNEDGFYSYAEKRRIEKEEVDKLRVTLDSMDDADENKIYNYFNKNSDPFDIQLKEVGVDREKVASSNIYDKMAAKSTTHYEGSFKIEAVWGKEPITVTNKFSKDSTLSMRDISSFM